MNPNPMKNGRVRDVRMYRWRITGFPVQELQASTVSGLYPGKRETLQGAGSIATGAREFIEGTAFERRGEAS